MFIKYNYKPIIEPTIGKNAFLQPFIINGILYELFINSECS